MKSNELIEDLIERTRDVLNRVEALNHLNPEVLEQRPSEQSWNALECIEHLNRYEDFYLPEIRKRLEKSKRYSAQFSSGLLGDYFAKSMMPKEKLNKMKTFKSMNPAHTDLSNQVIQKFVHQQHEMLRLLDKSRKADLTKTKTSITISKWIKLRLGDTLRVVIYHNQRHVLQAENAVHS